MKNYQFFYIVVSAILLFFFQSTFAQTAGNTPKDTEPVKMIEYIAGTWKLDHVEIINDGGQNAAATPADENSNAFQVVEFGPNARYKLSNGSNVMEEGSYRVNEQNGILYMESDRDDTTPTEWNVDFKDHSMTMVARGGNNNTKRQKLVLSKSKAGVSTTEDHSASEDN